jgi:hypothetical protein
MLLGPGGAEEAMGGTVGVVVRCETCGPVQVDPVLVELHRDRANRFTLATFLCLGCGQLGASRCPDRVVEYLAAGVAERQLRCTSAPSVPDAPGAA